jgi:transposase
MMELYRKLTSSDMYKEWKSKNKDSFLCSYVSIQSPQFDFYNKDDTITSFAMNDEIEIIENEKIYNKTDIKPIDLKKIKSSEEKVADIAKKKYRKETFTKQIVILQNSKKQLWIAKALDEQKKGKLTVMLLPVDTSTAWFQDKIMPNCEVRWLRGRIKLDNGKHPMYASMLAIFNGKHKVSEIT